MFPWPVIIDRPFSSVVNKTSMSTIFEENDKMLHITTKFSINTGNLINEICQDVFSQSECAPSATSSLTTTLTVRSQKDGDSTTLCSFGYEQPSNILEILLVSSGAVDLLLGAQYCGGRCNDKILARRRVFRSYHMWFHGKQVLSNSSFIVIDSSWLYQNPGCRQIILPRISLPCSNFSLFFSSPKSIIQ